MNRLSLMGAAAVLLGFGLVGCQNTAEGVAQDADKNVKAVEGAAVETGKAIETGAVEAGKTVEQGAAAVGNAVGEATDGAGAALVLTPKIKSALLSDPKLKTELDNTANKIDVDSTEDKVVLKGNVSSNGMKKLAGDVAMKAIKDANGKQTVDNQLMVSSR